MDVDSGRFTVPVSGVYMFLLNVYAAPRDPVVLSLRSVASPLLSSLHLDCSERGKEYESENRNKTHMEHSRI